jgi:hypothetical protein
LIAASAPIIASATTVSPPSGIGARRPKAWPNATASAAIPPVLIASAKHQP